MRAGRSLLAGTIAHKRPFDSDLETITDFAIRENISGLSGACGPQVLIHSFWSPWVSCRWGGGAAPIDGPRQHQHNNTHKLSRRLCCHFSSTEPMMGRTNPPRLSGEEPLHKVRAD
jgi:hypothetical protein